MSASHVLNKVIAGVLCLSGLCMACNVLADITMVWRKTPLNITVPFGTKAQAKELEVSFPEKVLFGMPADLSGKLSVMNDNKTLYLTASQPFAMHHNIVVKTQSGKMVLLNISASKDGGQTPINVVYLKHNIDTKLSTTQSTTTYPSKHISMQVLVRYATQQLYAPKRLLKRVPGISQVGEFHGKTYKLVPDGSLMAMPLYSFAGGGMVVTAVLLRNNLATPVTIAPQMFCGHWVAFSPFPQSRLLAHGSRFDSTTGFFVSRNDFLSVFNAGCAA